ncbi:PRD domain-containing protein [Paenibacillus sp. P96]|uniref:PRD domain-containing protein n=1 Tax=Paenibacillus zeirhizosphaerae TaxID=2987519 RepID=A0ABT9FKK5_9BACL|nr:BglG family transcription antiterminator [Paenibacillus sp. P96]MDP4095258.1 PRD domain-containing protein [Paenibacillus sp. P96]
MNITKRQSEILEFLLQQTREVTAGDIAARINVSTRTILRELSAVEKWLEPHGVRLEKKSGIGIHLDADPSRLFQLRQQLFRSESVEYSAEERKIYSLCMLLDDSEPIKLLSLAADLKVTVATVSHDLDELQSWIGKRGLTLVRKRGYGVQITGRESDIRRAISELGLEHLDESDLFGRDTVRHSSHAMDKLMELIGRDVMLTVENALWQPNEKWLENMVESKYMELLIQLSVAVARIRRSYGAERLESEMLLGTGTNEEEEKIRAAMVERICDELSVALSLQFSEQEKRYFRNLFRSAEDRSTRLLPLDDLVLLEIVNELIRRVEERAGVHFGEDRLLREGLIAHVEPVLQRLKDGSSIRNPLLQQIRKDYTDLFEAVKGAVAGITELDVPDEEVGFLVMHFGASIERFRQLQREVRAIVVCTSGIGSSRLLATRLAKELPQIKIVDRASWFEAARIPKKDYDLVISTVDLPLEKDRYLKISPLLTQEESDRLRHFIQNITLKKVSGRQGQVVEPNQGLGWLVGLKDSLQEIVRIVQNFHIYPLDNREMDMNEVLYAMCISEVGRGTVHDPEAVAELLAGREQQGSQVIPDTPLALFHTRSRHIRTPSLSLYRLSEPLELEGAQEAVKQVLLMLGPRELSKESLEVLSEISALLLQGEMITLLEYGSRDEITSYMADQLADFFRSKLETGRTIQ